MDGWKMKLSIAMLAYQEDFLNFGCWTSISSALAPTAAWQKGISPEAGNGATTAFPLLFWLVMKKNMILVDGNQKSGVHQLSLVVEIPLFTGF